MRRTTVFKCRGCGKVLQYAYKRYFNPKKNQRTRYYRCQCGKHSKLIETLVTPRSVP